MPGIVAILATSAAVQEVGAQAGPVDSAAAHFEQASRAHNWAEMVTYGQHLPEACGHPARVSGLPRGKDTISSTEQIMAPARERIPCAQLLTAYIATNQPSQVSAIVTRITARFRLHHESALHRWYARQLRSWGGDDAGGLALADSVSRRNPAAATVHRGLLRHAMLVLARGASETTFNAPDNRVPDPHAIPEVWPSEPPPGTPFPRSRVITGIEFSGTYVNYARADTWYPSWGDDDTLYSSYMDGYATNAAGQDVLAGENNQTFGHAVIRGADPFHLAVTALQTDTTPPAPYEGHYSSANLMYHGVWYVGTYTLKDREVPACGDYCVLGPFVGFHWSTDKGKTWHQPPPGVTPAHPLFGETALDSARVKLSAAHFVDFGKDMRYSPDGKAYLVGHGATAPHSHNGWISGDQIYVARVTPSPETINDVKAWEFYAGRDAKGRPRWSHRFADITPIVDWPGHLGNTAVTYDAPLRKYLLFTTHGWPSVGPFDTIVLEADELTGPWRLVSYMKDFGPEAYFVNVPSKFISTDGRTMWLSYSANFADYMNGYLTQTYGTDPPGGKYAMVLHKIRLLGPGPGRPQPTGTEGHTGRRSRGS